MVSRSLLANFHQASNIFDNVGGRQCTAIALAALLFFVRLSNDDRTFHNEAGANVHNHGELFDHIESTDLDSILFEGSSLYAHICNEFGIEGYLGHEHLPSSVVGHGVHIEYLHDMFSGHTNPSQLPDTVLDDQGSQGFAFTDFAQGLHQAFSISNNVLATFQESSIAIHGNLNTQSFYLFDSHERNKHGSHSSNGAAVLLYFDSFTALLDFLKTHYQCFYQLTPVHFSPDPNEISVSDDVPKEASLHKTFSCTSGDSGTRSMNTVISDGQKEHSGKQKYTSASETVSAKLHHAHTHDTESVDMSEVFLLPNSTLTHLNKQDLSKIDHSYFCTNMEEFCDSVLLEHAYFSTKQHTIYPTTKNLSRMQTTTVDKDINVDNVSVNLDHSYFCTDMEEFCGSVLLEHAYCSAKQQTIYPTKNLSRMQTSTVDKDINVDVVVNLTVNISQELAFPHNIQQQELPESVVLSNDHFTQLTKQAVNSNNSVTQITKQAVSEFHSNKSVSATVNKDISKRKRKVTRKVNSLSAHEFINHEHSYYSKIKKRKHKVKTTAISLEQIRDIRHIPFIVSDFEHVSNCCEIATTQMTDAFMDDTDIFLSSPRHNHAYEIAIRERPSWHCASCDKFLFKNQCLKLCLKETGSEFMQAMGLSGEHVLCKTCYIHLSKGKVPSTFNGNDLKLSPVPDVLKCLTFSERKLISKLQTFLTLAVLPGGQFCERGTVLHLPVNLSEIVHQLPLDPNEGDQISVSYENGHARVLSKHKVSPFKIFRALQWLKTNNPIYADLNLNSAQSKLNQINDGSHDIDFESTFHEAEHEMMIPAGNLGFQCKLQADVQSTSSLVIGRSKHSPVNIYEIEKGEEMAFPWLFPEGKYGFKHERSTKVWPSMYLRNRVYHKDDRFRKDMMYLLQSAVAYDLFLMKQAASIFMQLKSPFATGNQNRVCAKDVTNPVASSSVYENSYMFMKSIRGTVAYFRNALYDLLAMFRSLGPPTLFVTLSADDLHWPELEMAAKNVSYAEASSKNSFAKTVIEDPFISSVHFHRRFHSLMKHVILGPSEPLGKVKDYFQRVEFQNRGSPHIHMFLWIDGFSDVVDESTIAILLQYIDKTISTDFPDKDTDAELFDLVKRVQIHSHTRYCSSNFRSTCRFGFPKPACVQSKVFTNFETNNNTKGKFYQTKRSAQAQYVNAYNSEVLRHWRANMDIQVICNAEGAAYYVCSYICKSEPDDLKNALGQLIQSMSQQAEQLTSFQRLLKIGHCLIQHRRMSTQEASNRLGSDWLVKSSRKIIYLNTRLEKNSFKKLKKRSILKDLADNSTDIFQTNILDYYRHRPIEFKHRSLFYFASWFETCPAPQTNSARIRTNQLQRVYITSFDVWLKKRSKPCVLRFPSFALLSEDYFLCMLMLLYPHYSETELLQPCSSFQESFFAKRSHFDSEINWTHFSMTDHIETIIRKHHLCQQEIPTCAHDSNRDDSEKFDDTEADNILEEISVETDLQSPEVYDKASDLNTFIDLPSIEESIHCMQTSQMPDADFHRKIDQLTKCQKQALQIVQNHFCTQNPDPLYLFITGGAGVGKTFLTDVITEYLKRETALNLGVNPVLVCAPTGTAAKNVKGQTIHSLLQIPVSRFMTFQELSSYSLSRLQKKFQFVHTLLIDEISMVSDKFLTYISRRLSAIKCTNDPLGRLNIIVVGDLFQLKPVKGKYIFHNPLWKLFRPVFLDQNMRQQKNSTFVSLLQRGRVGCLSDDDIALLKSRMNKLPTSDIPQVLHIFPRRVDVDEHNQLCQSMLTESSVVIPALHFFSTHDPLCGQDVPTDNIPNDDTVAGALLPSLQISVNTRIMLTRNICTADGLVNGAIGTVESIDMVDGHVQTINVLFDDSNIANNHLFLGQNAVPIKRIEYAFTYSGHQLVRSQFPLIPCWACTVHKVQGLSLDQAALDLGSTIFEKGMSYVALSRLRTLQGLTLLRFNPAKFDCSEDVLEEYGRLRDQNHHSHNDNNDHNIP